MTIAAANASYQGTGPTVTSEVLAAIAGSGDSARNLVLTATVILDGSATTATINWIDGTAVLPFTPSGAIAFRSGGTGLSTIAAVALSSITTTSATLTFSAAGTNTQTCIFTILLFK